MIVILNTRAGTCGTLGSLQSKIAELFGAAGVHPKFIVVCGNEMSAAAKEAVAAHDETIVVGGGDGTISAVVAELAGTEKILGVLPLGTLNHFARDLRLPLDLESAVRTILERNIATVDLGEMNGRVFVNNSSLGIYPQIVRRRTADQARMRIGKWPAFAWATLIALRRFPFLDLRLQVGDQTLKRTTAFLFVGNNEYAIAGFRIGGRSRLDAGKLGLYLTHRVGRWGMIRLALRALFGHLNQEKDFEAYLVEEAFIESRRRSILVAADGEVNRIESPLHYRSRPSALRVIVPRNPAG